MREPAVRDGVPGAAEALAPSRAGSGRRGLGRGLGRVLRHRGAAGQDLLQRGLRASASRAAAGRPAGEGGAAGARAALLDPVCEGKTPHALLHDAFLDLVKSIGLDALSERTSGRKTGSSAALRVPWRCCTS